LLTERCVRVGRAANSEPVGLFQQLRLAADRGEDGGAADACGGGDLLDRCCRIAAFGEQAPGSSRDREPRRICSLESEPGIVSTLDSITLINHTISLTNRWSPLAPPATRQESPQMAPFVNSIEINRKPDDVFAYVDDLAKHGEWQQQIVSVHVETDGPTRVGSRATDKRGCPAAHARSATRSPSTTPRTKARFEASTARSAPSEPSPSNRSTAAHGRS
jgi:Polyketide cyclase / dehydrase and lipid transport.